MNDFFFTEMSRYTAPPHPHKYIYTNIYIYIYIYKYIYIYIYKYIYTNIIYIYTYTTDALFKKCFSVSISYFVFYRHTLLWLFNKHCHYFFFIIFWKVSIPPSFWIPRYWYYFFTYGFFKFFAFFKFNMLDKKCCSD